MESSSLFPPHFSNFLEVEKSNLLKVSPTAWETMDSEGQIFSTTFTLQEESHNTSPLGEFHADFTSNFHQKNECS